MVKLIEKSEPNKQTNGMLCQWSRAHDELQVNKKHRQIERNAFQKNHTNPTQKQHSFCSNSLESKWIKIQM